MNTASIIAVVMTKFPEPGRVKTRLTPALTQQQAAEVHRTFLSHWVGRLLHFGFGRVVLCHDPPEAESAFCDLVPSDRLEFLAQTPGDLGARMSAAHSTLCRAANTVLIFGADSPDVPDSKIACCCDALDHHTESFASVVLAPTSDGGFWSIGFGGQVDSKALLREIEWSSGREFDQVLARGTSLGYRILTPPENRWEDVDRAADLEKLLDRLSQSEAKSDRDLYNALSFVPRDRLKRAE